MNFGDTPDTYYPRVIESFKKDIGRLKARIEELECHIRKAMAFIEDKGDMTQREAVAYCTLEGVLICKDCYKTQSGRD